MESFLRKVSMWVNYEGYINPFGVYDINGDRLGMVDYEKCNNVKWRIDREEKIEVYEMEKGDIPSLIGVKRVVSEKTEKVFLVIEVVSEGSKDRFEIPLRRDKKQTSYIDRKLRIMCEERGYLDLATEEIKKRFSWYVLSHSSNISVISDMILLLSSGVKEDEARSFVDYVVNSEMEVPWLPLGYMKECV